MLALGLTLEQVVPMVTTNAAAMIGKQGEHGTLKPGVAATCRCSPTSVAASSLRQREEPGRSERLLTAAVLPQGRQALRRRCRDPAGGHRR